MNFLKRERGGWGVVRQWNEIEACLMIIKWVSTIPEMSRRVSTIEDQLFCRFNIFIDPFCPGLQSSSISFNSIKFWVKIITFFVVIYPVSTNHIRHSP